jgi:hypothetical protein
MRIIGDPFEEIPLDLAIIDPDGIVVSAGKGGVKFGTDGVVEQSIALKNVSFTKTGMYQIRISIPDSPPESLSFVVLLKG